MGTSRQSEPEERGPEASDDLLAVAALVGETFSARVVAAVCDVELDDALEELDSAASDGTLAYRDGTLRFIDPRQLEPLALSIPLSRRLALEARIAEVLEEHHLTDLESHAADIAAHMFRALPKGDPEKVLRYGRLAGDVALRERRYSEAATSYEMALKAFDLLTERREDRLAVLLSLGEALVRCGDLPSAWEAYGEVAELARRWNMPDELVAAAVGFGAGLGGFEVRLFDARQIALLEEAADIAHDDGQRALVLARLSVALSFMEDDERRRELAHEAVKLARASGHSFVLIQALSSYCDAFSGPEWIDERLAAATEMLKTANRSHDPEMELLARRFRVVAFLEQGAVDAAEREQQAYGATSAAVSQPLSQWYLPLWRGMRAVMDGDHDEALRLADEVSAIGASAHSANANLLADGLRFVTLRLRGAAQEALDMLLTFLSGPDEVVPTMRVALATALAEAGKLDGARVEFDRVMATLNEFPRDSEWLPSMVLLAETALTLQDRSAVEILHEELAPFAAMFAVEGIGVATYGSVARQLGSLAAFLGQTEAAAKYFDLALVANRGAGSRALIDMTVHDRIVALAESAGDTTRDPAGPNRFQRQGDLWALAYDGLMISVRDAKGMHDLVTLLRSPFRSFHVSELASSSPEAHAVLTGAGDEVIDPQALHAYRSRLQELQEVIDDAEAGGDYETLARARGEMDFLTDEVGRTVGIGGSPRKVNQVAERARKAVGARIRNSIERIEKHHPTLGRHLRHAVRTGSFCSYDPESPMEWVT